jgi:outer membrane protein insertion porin family
MRAPPLLLALALALEPHFVPRAHAEAGSEAVLGFRSQPVTGVEFSGDPLPENVRARLGELTGKEFSATAVRSLLLWCQSNGVDALLEVYAVHSPRGVQLRVNALQRRRIGSIAFEGNITTPTNVLQQQIDIKEDTEFEPELVKAAAQKLSVYYSKVGYLASDVKTSFDEKTRELKFTITEGEPTLITEVTLSPITSIEDKVLRERYQRDLLEVFGLHAGDRIQRDRVLEGVNAIKDWLRDHDFLLARDPNLEYKVAANGRVGFYIDISYGPRIRYGFRGNKQFSYRELSAIVRDVKEVASGTDYLASVRRKVLEAYREIGFANARITTLVREDPTLGIRYVSLVVNEGDKIYVENYDIEGVQSMNKEDAEKRFKSLGTRLVQRDFLDEAGVNRTAELFAEQLKSEGYLSAKLEYVKIDYNQDHTKARVGVLFTEGVQTRVGAVEIVGVKSFSTPEVLEMFGLKEGEPFNIFAFEKGLQVLVDKYQEIGNLSAQVVNEAGADIVRYNKDNSLVNLRVEVDEGPAYKVGEITVRGNQQTHARVILRELPFISGDVLTRPHLAEAEDNLRKLNLFGEVHVSPTDHPGSDDVKDVLVYVRESEPGTFDVVPGIRNDLGARLGFELGYQNLGGWNRSLNASAVFNRRLQDYYSWGNSDYKRLEYKFTVGFREPYLAEWPVVFTSSLDFLRRQYRSFYANVRKLTVGFKRELSRYLTGFIEYGYEQTEISEARLPYLPSDNGLTYIGTVTPGIIIDSRRDIDNRPNSFNPMKGFYSVNRFETGAHPFGSMSNVAYYRATTFNSTYLRLYEGVVLALAMNVGWERSNATGMENNVQVGKIPDIKLFRLGGLSSIRGYDEDGLEVGTVTNVFGTLGSLNYRGELRVPIQGNFGTAFFLDAGNLFVDRYNFQPNQLRSSIGTGLRYNTAVGPVLLDFAWRLQSNSQVGDTCVTTQNATNQSCISVPTDRYKIHFAIGVF